MRCRRPTRVRSTAKPTATPMASARHVSRSMFATPKGIPATRTDREHAEHVLASAKRYADRRRDLKSPTGFHVGVGIGLGVAAVDDLARAHGESRKACVHLHARPHVRVEKAGTAHIGHPVLVAKTDQNPFGCGNKMECLRRDPLEQAGGVEELTYPRLGVVTHAPTPAVVNGSLTNFFSFRNIGNSVGVLRSHLATAVPPWRPTSHECRSFTPPTSTSPSKSTDRSTISPCGRRPRMARPSPSGHDEADRRVRH